VALKTPPIIKYRLDFGMLPGGITSVITAPIVAFVNYLVNIVLVGMLLWPKRITVRAGGHRRAQGAQGIVPGRERHSRGWAVLGVPATAGACPLHRNVPRRMAPVLWLLQVPLLSWNGFLPANDPDIDTDVERLEGRPQGVVKVSVIRAKDLKSFDVVTGGLSDTGGVG
jgi:hypothetical protein